MTEVQLRFPRRYSASITTSNPQGGHRFHSAGERNAPELVVEIVPDEGTRWVGVFEGVSVSPLNANGVFSTPSLTQVCVVAYGQAYFVDVNRPDDVHVVEEIYPVTSVHDAPGAGLLLLVDFTHIAAFTGRGLAWKSARIASDGLELTGIRSGFATGRAWSAPDRADVTFRLDLATGTHEGGLDLSRFAQ